MTECGKLITMVDVPKYFSKQMSNKSEHYYAL
jgi:hypothetical protein